MANWFRAPPAPPPVLPAPVIANQAFQPHEHAFWLLYERCRYNGIICTARVVDAVRTDNRANLWLLISTAGAGLAGGIKILARLDTDMVWEAATLISVVLAVLALYKKAPEIKYTVFASIGVFDRLAADVQHLTRRFRVSGGEQDFEVEYRRVFDALGAELNALGPDHTGFEATHRRRLDRTLRRTLLQEGIARP